MIGKRAIVAGSTGSIGRLVVQTCLEDPRVGKVTAIVRKTLPNDRAEQMWGKKATVESNNKLVQVQVDYPTLNVNDTNLKDVLKNHDAFITALGVYSGNTTESEMRKIEGTYNAILATLARNAENGATRGAYLSGQGVKQPTLEGRAGSMFGRVKGHVEESLSSIFVNNNNDNSSSNPNEGSSEEFGAAGAHVSVRPAAIFDRPGPPVYGFLDGTLLKMWPFRTLVDTSFGITAHDIAKGMVQGALFDTDKSHVRGNTIWENVTLKEAARRYDANKPSEEEES